MKIIKKLIKLLFGCCKHKLTAKSLNYVECEKCGLTFRDPYLARKLWRKECEEYIAAGIWSREEVERYMKRNGLK